MRMCPINIITNATVFQSGQYTPGKKWCRRIEQAITRDLLATSETADLFVKHDLDQLTRSDLQTRYAAHAAGIQAGFLTRNEARQMENLGLAATATRPTRAVRVRPLMSARFRLAACPLARVSAAMAELCGPHTMGSGLCAWLPQRTTRGASTVSQSGRWPIRERSEHRANTPPGVILLDVMQVLDNTGVGTGNPKS